MQFRLILIPLALIAAGAAPAPAERRFMLTDFDRVRLSGPFIVEVKTGGPPGATVSGDGRAAERVNLRVDGGMLVIAASTQGWDGWRDDRESQLVIRVSGRQLRGARVNGGGKLTIDRVSGQRVELGLAGSGQLDIGSVTADQMIASLTGTGVINLKGGKVRTARFISQGAGAIDAAGTSIADLNVQSQSAGDSRFTASLTAAVAALGTGAVRVEGNAVCRLSGPGPMSCAGKTAER
ncbi:DUF2807 domain-containing protein [Sphingomonas sp. MG17]|jgi:hypothetical protein|uniref:DUF2807 domain-containing protein n=1 Tax=Sphingomonas tagetis TaxID=2949092 RepID=A0A9X2HGJ8_9SPHN|nr:DUF2807 domain-containing protein [Sphingomonas tagetis]MCP3730388.1 DUF2807 domain-containing protein [Sphingomonas tagetis]